ncbi:MAG: hypothetical protein KJO40_08765 [Deltaproteobacteria bacterium]|nr:hypothetical protein [Deltaproteobacteria bacterium]MBT8464736.1 hypothetical protein [Deltaproteobacteria bacterium]NND30154.1 hypothetical protein [Myxococcales bacterium]NNK41014.1 hypothetical protein [Myxococcales bacterium]
MKAGWLWLSRGFGYFVGAPIPLSPRPGQGPPKWLQRAGKFRVALKATSASGDYTAMVDVQGRGDPGEVALCLALGQQEAPPGGGVLTPALALGSVLRERLVAAEGGEFTQFRVLAET